MIGAASDLMELMKAAGGTFALSFLVALVLGICVMTLLFLGSAVVVLERFARSARRPQSFLLASAAWALALAPLARGALWPESETTPLDESLRALAIAAAIALLALATAQVVLALVLRFVPSRVLARIGTVAVGLGYALVVGGVGAPGYAAAPTAVAAAVAGLLWLRRRRSGAPLGEPERLVRILVGALAVGWIASALAPDPTVLAGFGAALLVAFGAAVVLGLLPLATAGFLDMRGSVEWFVATRYLFAKRRQTFISVITLICVAGVAAGVWLIITVLSVMNGFERTWREEIIGNRAHFTIHLAGGPIRDYLAVLDTVDHVPGVVGATPYVDGEGMVRGDRGEVLAVRVRGIDPDRIVKVTDLSQDLRPGSEHALDELRADGKGNTDGDGPPGRDGRDPAIIVGSELANHLGLRVGDTLTVISPFGGPPTPLGPGPRLKRFRLVGVFQSSFFQYDEVYTYTSLAAAQDFRRAGDVAHGIEVRTTDYYRSRKVASDVRAALDSPAYFTRDWKDFFPAFFQALKTERVMMFVLLTMIMVVAAFAIVVTLIMMIMEKSSDIAILKTMGATDAAIERVFAIEGTLIGLLGTVVGVVAGIAVTTQLDWVQGQIEALTGIDTLPATIYQFSTLPWEIDPFQVAVVVGIAMVLALGATLLPSRHGARLDPAEALRYE
ncbi:MAG TPA: lipoprotein-releasing ABC transporter permease subunit [Myxococcota bacterium]|nr:lipoprotein-releasing ABC transporter permease subunit [Myxococcota bacterium]